MSTLTARATSWLDRDHWIGLQNTVNACGCLRSTPDAECHACRALWTWVDGANASLYQNWQDDDVDPDSGEACGRIHDDHTWFGWPCSASKKMKFICKKGTFVVQ